MSPHAPTSVSNLQQPPTPIDHLLDKNTPAPTPTDQHDNKSITASPYVHQTASGEPPSYTDHGGTTGVPQTLTAPGSVPQQQPGTPTPATATATTPGTATGAATGVATATATGAATGSTQCGTISVKKLEMQQQQTMPMLTVKQEPGTGIGTVLGQVAGRVAQTTAVATQEAVTNLFKLYKPPQLTLKDADSFNDEEWLKDVIYDFSFQESW